MENSQLNNNQQPDNATEVCKKVNKFFLNSNSILKFPYIFTN